MSFFSGGSLESESENHETIDLASNEALKSGTDVLLVTLIFSDIRNRNIRDAIRNTWLSNAERSKDVASLFVIGTLAAGKEDKKLISEEEEQYHDILVFPNLNDTFFNLTTKLLIAFGWLVNEKVFGDTGASLKARPFDKFQYVLKCDDDSFVRLQEIVNELKTRTENGVGENLYWGFFDGRAVPLKSGKYKEPEWRICDHYLPYAVGGGYVLSYAPVRFLAKNWDSLKRYVNEDVSVGAWLSSYANLNRAHEPRFNTEYTSRGCHNSYLISHKQTPRTMRKLYSNLKKTGKLCEKERQIRFSYVYNWDAPPSQCCLRIDPSIP